MPDDRDIARKAVLQRMTEQEVRLMDVPGYMEWSSQKVDEGVSAAFIAHLDATSMFVTPEELGALRVADFEDLLADLIEEFGE